MEVHNRNRWRIRRRDFLVFSAGLAAAMSFGDLSGAEVSHAADAKFPEGRCEGKTEKKVLVTYASKYGSTGGIAEAIGKELCSREVAADIALIKNAGSIGSYQGVVVGSAIYRGRWMPEMLDFVRENRDTLCQVPVAYFLACMTLSRPTAKNRAEVLSYMDPVLAAVPEIKPVALGTFAGVLDYSNLSWPDKKILKYKGTPAGDFRDFEAIHAWAREPLYAKFFQ